MSLILNWFSFFLYFHSFSFHFHFRHNPKRGRKKSCKILGGRYCTTVCHLCTNYGRCLIHVFFLLISVIQVLPIDSWRWDSKLWWIFTLYSCDNLLAWCADDRCDRGTRRGVGASRHPHTGERSESAGARCVLLIEVASRMMLDSTNMGKAKFVFEVQLISKIVYTV